MKKRGRLRYIDFYKAISIILVVLAHINFANQSIKALICSFNMPAFFFASGLFLNPDADTSFSRTCSFVWKKIKTIIFPFLIWGVVYAELTIHNLALIAYGSHATLERAGSLTSLWFFPALFFCFVYYSVARLILKKRFNLPIRLVLMILSFAISWVLPRRAGGYPWCFDVSFSAFGFVLLGNIAIVYIKKFHDICTEGNKGIAICLLVLVLSAVGTLTYKMNTAYSDGYVLMAVSRYGNYLFYLMTALIGIVFTMALAVFLDVILHYNGLARVIQIIGENTMAILLVHKPFIRLFKSAFSFVRVPTAAALIITCIGTLVCSCVIAKFLNWYVPAAVGKIPQQSSE